MATLTCCCATTLGSAALALPALAAGTYLVRPTAADRQPSRMLLVGSSLGAISISYYLY